MAVHQSPLVNDAVPGFAVRVLVQGRLDCTDLKMTHKKEGRKKRERETLREATQGDLFLFHSMNRGRRNRG